MEFHEVPWQILASPIACPWKLHGNPTYGILMAVPYGTDCSPVAVPWHCVAVHTPAVSWRSHIYSGAMAVPGQYHGRTMNAHEYR